MDRTNLFAAATLVLGLFACDRSADRASQTNTTSAPQPADTSGAPTPAQPAAVDTSTSVNVDAKDGGRAAVTTTSAGDLDMNAKDGGHRAGSDVDMNAKDGGHRAGATRIH